MDRNKRTTDRQGASKAAPLPDLDRLPDDMDEDRIDEEDVSENEARACPPDDASSIQRPPADS